jgi:hypothetical protein
VIAALEVALGAGARSIGLQLSEVSGADEAQRLRDERLDDLCLQWREMRRVTRRRGPRCLEDLAFAAGRLAIDGRAGAWRLVLGEASVPEPSMLIRRVLNSQEPEREPALPRRRLRRRPLCLLADVTSEGAGAGSV